MLNCKKTVMKLISLMAIVIMLTFGATFNVSADTVKENVPAGEEMNENAENDDTNVRLFTSLSISLNGGNGTVWTTAKNDFTLFPSTVLVVLQLYASYTYTEYYQNMSMVASNSTTDLDMGQTITAQASTGGEQKYYIARMRYQVNGGNWQEKIIGPALYNANGEFVSLD